MPAGRPRRSVTSLLAGLVAAALITWLARTWDAGHAPPPSPSPSITTPASTVDPVLAAFRAHRSDVEVETSARVVRVLRDDREGARHERFLIRVADTLTVLVAHNIDLAPRIPLNPGDSVQVRGEYVWNTQGGVIHWTHHDTRAGREGGWVRHEGRTYQ